MSTSTGIKLTGTVLSSTGWTNCTTVRLNTLDTSRAIATGNAFKLAELTTYGFGIPTGATIDGIELSADFVDNTPSTLATLQFYLSYDGGAHLTSTKSDTVNGTTPLTKVYGGSTDTWGRTWDVSDFSDANFLVGMQGKSATVGSAIGVDYLQIIVYYTSSTSSNFLSFFI